MKNSMCLRGRWASMMRMRSENRCPWRMLYKLWMMYTRHKEIYKGSRYHYHCSIPMDMLSCSRTMHSPPSPASTHLHMLGSCHYCLNMYSTWHHNFSTPHYYHLRSTQLHSTTHTHSHCPSMWCSWCRRCNVLCSGIQNRYLGMVGMRG